MKKAKEYAAEIINTYIEKDQDAALHKAAEAIINLFKEYTDIQNARSVRNYGPMLAILKEQHLKWVSICKHVNKQIKLLPEDAFLNEIKVTMTMIYPNLLQIL